MTYTTDSSGAIVNRDIKPNSDVTPILPTPMVSTIVRNIDTLSTATNLTVSFTTINPFPSGGKIIFKMPTDQIDIATSVTCFKGDLSSSLTCTSVTSGSYYLVTIDEWCSVASAPCAAATSLSFIIQGVKNPALLAANVAATSWEVLTATALSYSIDGTVSGLKPTPILQGIAITLSTVAVNNPTVYKETTVLFNFIPNSNLPSNALIDIGFPTEFAFVPTTQT